MISLVLCEIMKRVYKVLKFQVYETQKSIAITLSARLERKVFQDCLALWLGKRIFRIKKGDACTSPKKYSNKVKS